MAGVNLDLLDEQLTMLNLSQTCNSGAYFFSVDLVYGKKRHYSPYKKSWLLTHRFICQLPAILTHLLLDSVMW